MNSSQESSVKKQCCDSTLSKQEKDEINTLHKISDVDHVKMRAQIAKHRRHACYIDHNKLNEALLPIQLHRFCAIATTSISKSSKGIKKFTKKKKNKDMSVNDTS